MTKDNTAYMDQVENPNNKLCVINLVYIYYTLCHSDRERFFTCPASKKELKQLKLDSPKVRFSKKNVAGKNKFNDFIKEIASVAGFDDADRCTGHAPRNRAHDVLAENNFPLNKQLSFCEHKTLTMQSQYLMNHSITGRDKRCTTLMVNSILQENVKNEVKHDVDGKREKKHQTIPNALTSQIHNSIPPVDSTRLSSE